MSPTSTKGSDGLVGYFVDTREPGVENDLVPLRGAGRVVADRDLKAGLLGQAGELFLPGTNPVAVRAAGIGGDE